MRASCVSACLLAVSLVQAPPVLAEVPAGDAAPPDRIAGPPALPDRLSASEPDARERARRAQWKLDAVIATSGQVADLVSTEIALARPGTREANPIVASRSLRVPLKLGVAAGTALACRQLRLRGKHTQARLLALASFAVGAAAVVHNTQVATR